MTAFSIRYPALKQSCEGFADSYEIKRKLGEGGYGVVYKCYAKRDRAKKNRKSYAVKKVPKDMFEPEEIEVVQYLRDCPTIVHVQVVFEEIDYTFIVMDQMRGGDMYKKLCQKGVYSEPEAKIVARTLLETIGFCQNMGVAHRDIKPENILIENKNDDTRIRIGDFGLAKKFRDDAGEDYYLYTAIGTREYAAPEVFGREYAEEPYDERCDIWSIGAVIYTIMGGYTPFEGDSPEEMEKAVCCGDFEFHEEYWGDVSQDAKAVISALMVVDPDNRCTIDEALEYNWFAS